jgi:hypothetical protein
MDEPLDELYIQWLYRQVAPIRLKNPARTYWALVRHLFTKEFVWLIPNDDNRQEDGRDLRREFVEDMGVDADPEWMGVGCSMLEMLIGLSRRLSFEAEGESRGWFWELLENLGLRHITDKHYNTEPGQDDLIEETLDTVIWRTYETDGQGGLFPLQETEQDQTDVELWYQLSYYLLERA